MTRAIILAGAAAAVLSACAPASEHAAEVRAAEQNNLTVGTVQREIRAGMSAGEVAASLGAPNVVTSNPGGGETWIYDRISTQNVYSRSAGGASVLLLGGAAAAGASSTSQRTLTIIVKYGPDGLVEDFSYRQSSF